MMRRISQNTSSVSQLNFSVGAVWALTSDRVKSSTALNFCWPAASTPDMQNQKPWCMQGRATHKAQPCAMQNRGDSTKFSTSSSCSGTGVDIRPFFASAKVFSQRTLECSSSLRPFSISRFLESEHKRTPPCSAAHKNKKPLSQVPVELIQIRLPAFFPRQASAVS